MHTASPFILDDNGDVEASLIRPAVGGTRNVLESVNKSGSVKRVVLTSSMAAIYGDNMDMKKQGLDILDETIWNTTSSARHGAYSYSKTMAEKAGWEMAEEATDWDLVTIHPGFVMGPSLTKRVDSTSIKTLLRILRGELSSGSPDLPFIFSDVRDVAKGHVLAAFTQEAKGRYIIANEAGGLINIGEIIGEAMPNKYKVPKRVVPKWVVVLVAPMLGLTRAYVKNNVGYPLRASNKKSIDELKINYHTLNETVIDHVRQLEEDKLI